MKLIKPTPKYAKSFRRAFLEIKKREEHALYCFWDINTTAKEYIAAAKKREKGQGLPQGWVPHSTYWLIDKGAFVGEAQIRHRLSSHLRKIGGHIGYLVRPSKRRQGYGKKILALALKKAKKIGIKKVLITCDSTNIGSKKIIETNGGIFEKATNMGRGKPKKLLYWINLS